MYVSPLVYFENSRKYSTVDCRSSPQRRPDYYSAVVGTARLDKSKGFTRLDMTMGKESLRHSELSSMVFVDELSHSMGSLSQR